jgi:hypothetical protein
LLIAAVVATAGAEPLTVTDTLEYEVTGRVLFENQRDADVIEVTEPITAGTGTPVKVGRIQRIPQEVPLPVLQSVWDQALATCQTTRSKKVVNYCAAYSYTPTRPQCETGQVTLPSTVTVNCCTNFGIIDTASTYPTCATGFFSLPGKANFTVSVPSSLRTFSVGAGIGPRPTQPAPADFDVGMELTYAANVATGVELEIAQNDGGLLDVAYHTRARLKSSADGAYPGEVFTLEASHDPIVSSTGPDDPVPARRSYMASEYPAAGVSLRYYLDLDLNVEAEYAYLDQTTGQQVRRKDPVMRFRTADLPISYRDDLGRLTGEIFGLRLGLFEGLDLRLLEDMPYRPPELSELFGSGYQLQIPPIPAGTTLPLAVTWPFRCPAAVLYSLAGQLTPAEDIAACDLVPSSPFAIELAKAALQVPALETPAGTGFDGGVTGFASVTPVPVLRNYLDPVTGALVSSTPSAFRAALNFNPSSPKLTDFVGDSSKLSADYARFELDLDGLFSLASGTGTPGVSVFGTTIGVPLVFNLELNSWDSDLVLWLAYDQELRFEPNLEVDLYFSKPVQVRQPGHGSFETIALGEKVTLPVSAFAAAEDSRLEVVQPEAGVVVVPVYSLRNNRFKNTVLPTTSFAWDNTFLQAALGGALATIMQAAGFPFEPDVAAVRTTLSAPPARGQDIGGPARPLTGLGFADRVGTFINIAALTPLDTDGDGVPDHLDNCTLVPNPNQLDADSDWYGNACDADLNNDGQVNFADLALFRSAFGTTGAAADLDGSGGVNFADLALFRGLFGRPPGPSGLAP